MQVEIEKGFVVEAKLSLKVMFLEILIKLQKHGGLFFRTVRCFKPRRLR